MGKRANKVPIPVANPEPCTLISLWSIEEPIEFWEHCQIDRAISQCSHISHLSRFAQDRTGKRSHRASVRQKSLERPSGVEIGSNESGATCVYPHPLNGRATLLGAGGAIDVGCLRSVAEGWLTWFLQLEVLFNRPSVLPRHNPRHTSCYALLARLIDKTLRRCVVCLLGVTEITTRSIAKQKKKAPTNHMPLGQEMEVEKNGGVVSIVFFPSLMPLVPSSPRMHKA